jgi:16S rRNA (uracil1498-N3)-methyltransferase
MARLWRLYHPDLPDEAGAEVLVGSEDSHHARKVLRLREGDEIALFDGAGHEWITRMIGSEGERVQVRLERRLLDPQTEAPLEVVLFQGLLRPERMDWVVQKATEVGIATIHPFVSERAETRGGGKNKLERWRRIAVESCKQCGRRQLPRIEPLEALPGAPLGDSPALLLQPGPGSTPLSDLCDGPAPASVQIAVGPQSGFTPEEVETHERAGWRPAALGPRVLRADTAGAITAAILLHRWGDLG